jgi:hypothetical protein
MKRMLTVIATAALVAVALSQPVAMAKGPVDRIELTGPTLRRPIEVTQGDALLAFSPWGQAFLGDRLGSQPDVADGLTVTMYLADETGVPWPIYRFTYYRQDGGVIYLPGLRDPDHELNASTIATFNDGHWFAASPAWQAFVAGLMQIQPPSTGDAGLK